VGAGDFAGARGWYARHGRQPGVTRATPQDGACLSGRVGRWGAKPSYSQLEGSGPCLVVASHLFFWVSQGHFLWQSGQGGRQGQASGSPARRVEWATSQRTFIPRMSMRRVPRTIGPSSRMSPRMVVTVERLPPTKAASSSWLTLSLNDSDFCRAARSCTPEGRRSKRIECGGPGIAGTAVARTGGRRGRRRGFRRGDRRTFAPSSTVHRQADGRFALLIRDAAVRVESACI